MNRNFLVIKAPGLLKHILFLCLILSFVRCGVPSSDTSRTMVQDALPTPTLDPTFTPTPIPANAAQPLLTATPQTEPSLESAGLSGQILDQNTNQPIANARITAGTASATTDVDGRYTLTNVVPGQYVLSVTHPDYDPGLSSIFTVVGGDESVIDVPLYEPDTSPYPEDPMLTNPLDPNGAPTAEDAERLAREQGLTGEVVDIRETKLRGEYLVNYNIGDDIRAAVAEINHEAWELTDEKGRTWWIIKVCGNLASLVPGQAPFPTPAPRPLPPMAEVKVTGVAIHGCASKDCDEIGAVRSGERVEVFGCLADGSWCEIGWSDGRGWCTGQALRQLAVAEAVPVATEAWAFMTHQLGFSDEHIALAASQGFELRTVREVVINDQSFVAFYLLGDYKPRVINDIATTILIYRGTASKTESFVHRIDVREPIEHDQITTLPGPTGWSLTMPFANEVLIAYEVAGFKLRAQRRSTDSEGTRYNAVIAYLDDFFHAITFEETGEGSGTVWLETYFFPKLPAPGEIFVDSRQKYTFDEAWAGAQADFVPRIRVEKALYALGCNFSKGEENTLGAVGKFGEKEAYHGKEYVLYTCTLLTDYDTGWLGRDFQSNNFVAAYEFDGRNYRRLWNTLYLDTSTISNWGNITGNQFPDLVIDKERASTSTGATYRGSFEMGQEVFQLTSAGDLIDLFTDEDGNKLDIDSGYSIEFSDLDNDGIKEIVVNSIAFGLYGGKRMESLYTIATRKVYRLHNDLYYVPAKNGFEFLCQNAIDGLIQPDGNGSTVIMIGFSAYTTLVTCDAVGMRQEGWRAIEFGAEKSAAMMDTYPEDCRNWLMAVYQDLASKAASDADLPLFETDRELDWDTLFSEAYKQGCRI